MLKNQDFTSVVRPPKIAGIKANLPAYKVAWQINHCYGMNFALNLDWQKEVKDKQMSLHQHYFYQFEDVELNWHLVNNKGSSAFFFQSRPMFDFLLVCDGDDIYQYFEKAIDSISRNRHIEHVYPFDFDLLKSKASYYHNIIRNKYFIEDLHV
jgi:hypothetical protein